MTIDRRAVVTRHDPRTQSYDPLSPLTVGNGEFAFTADLTGLQTFADRQERSRGRAEGRSVMPLGTQAQWAYHWAPNPDGWTLEDAEESYESVRGPIRFPSAYDYMHDKAAAAAAGTAPGYYFWANPQRIHLARIGLLLPRLQDGTAAGPEHLEDVDQHLSLWTGELTSSFRLDGAEVRVST